MGAVAAMRDRKMARRKKQPPRKSRAKVTDDDRTIYAILRAEFTAADLQKYTEVEPLVPAEQVLADLEKTQRKAAAKKKA
jgi:hypothetical protein